MRSINSKGNGALMCARMVYNTGLTRSVNGKAKASLLETIAMFIDYHSETLLSNSVVFERLELFLCEADMHEEQKPWQTIYFK